MSQAKIKKNFRKFWKRYSGHFKVGLIVLLGILALNQSFSTQSLMSGTLNLFDDSAPENVPKFTDEYIKEKWTSNDALIENLAKESLIFKLINIVKYVLGGVFMVYLGLYVITFLGSGDKTEASTKFKDKMMYVFIGFAILALADPFSDALNVSGLKEGGESGDILTNPEILKESARIVGFSFQSAVRLIQYLLGAIALLTMGISGFKIITAGGDEEAVKNSRKSLVWASLGLIFATIPLGDVLAPTDEISKVVGSKDDPLVQHVSILDAGKLQARMIAIKYVKYFQTFIGAGAIFSLFLAGFKMVAASGQEETITRQRKMITWIFMGLTIILLSEVFVNIFMPIDKYGDILSAGKVSKKAIGTFSEQIGGLTNFFITFAGGLAVLALIVGALYISTAVANPEQAEKGKKILLAATLGIIIVISAYAVVNTLLWGKAG